MTPEPTTPAEALAASRVDLIQKIREGIPEPEPVKIDWRVTRAIRPADLRCDHCGRQANSIHFVPWVVECRAVFFACPSHCPVPEGYWIPVEEWFADPDEWSDHIGRKNPDPDDYTSSGTHALCLLQDRFYDIEIQLAGPPRSSGLSRESRRVQTDAQRGVGGRLDSGLSLKSPDVPTRHPTAEPTLDSTPSPDHHDKENP